MYQRQMRGIMPSGTKKEAGTITLTAGGRVCSVSWGCNQKYITLFS